MLVVTEQPSLGGVGLEAVHKLVWAAQRGGVPAVDLVGGDTQPLPGDAAKETKGEQAVVATDQDPRGDVGPGPLEALAAATCPKLVVSGHSRILDIVCDVLERQLPPRREAFRRSRPQHFPTGRPSD
jgi:hypothetical protein